jgi:hypothetical protein
MSIHGYIYIHICIYVYILLSSCFISTADDKQFTDIQENMEVNLVYSTQYMFVYVYLNMNIYEYLHGYVYIKICINVFIYMYTDDGFF